MKKNPFKSNDIYNCLKLLAIEIILKKKMLKNFL